MSLAIIDDLEQVTSVKLLGVDLQENFMPVPAQAIDMF